MGIQYFCKILNELKSSDGVESFGNIRQGYKHVLILIVDCFSFNIFNAKTCLLCFGHYAMQR